jgi:hypothetical protein
MSPYAPQTYTTPTGAYSAGGQPVVNPRAVPQTTPAVVARAAKKNKKKKASGVPSIGQFLKTDEAFLNAKNALESNYQTLASRTGAAVNPLAGTRQGDLLEDYNITNQRLGEERTRSGQDVANDYAARGMLQSGLYNVANTDLANKYSQQSEDAKSSWERNRDKLGQDVGDARQLMNQQRDQARLAAIRRRAEQYGLTR